MIVEESQPHQTIQNPPKNLLIDCAFEMTSSATICCPEFLDSALLALLGGPAIVVAVEQRDGVALLAVVLIAKVALPMDL